MWEIFWIALDFLSYPALFFAFWIPATRGGNFIWGLAIAAAIIFFFLPAVYGPAAWVVGLAGGIRFIKWL